MPAVAMSRRTLLTQAATVAAGAALGGSVTQEADAGTGAPVTPASSVSPLAVRGRTEVWWSGAAAADGVAPQRVALTFDDGPTEQLTGTVLALLERAGIPATFFMIGMAARRHPDLVRRVRDAGHEIGNHTEDHVSAARTGRDAVLTSTQRGADTLAALTGSRPRWFRPPRGELTSATLLARRRAELAALPRVVAGWQAAGYRFVRLSDLIPAHPLQERP